MRVLWLSHFLPYPPKGGHLQRSFYLLKEASKRHEVHLVTLTRGSTARTPEEIRHAESELSWFCARVSPIPHASDTTPRRVVTAVIALLTRRPYDVCWLRSGELGAFLSSLARETPPDLVHVDTVGMWDDAAAFQGAPIVLNHHNIESVMLERRASLEQRAWAAAYLRADAARLATLEGRACGEAATNLVVSELDAERLRAVAGEIRCHVVANGVDTEYFTPARNIERDDRSIVFVGGMHWYPNRQAMRFFIREVWPKLSSDDPPFLLTVGGQDPPQEVVSAAEDERVTATGFVDDVRPLIDRASIYVCPILDGGGTRLKVLDALAMEKALVATRLAVEGLGLTEGDHYLAAETADEFAAAIRGLAADPARRERLGRSGRVLVEERFAWTRIGDELEAAYRDATRYGAREGS